ncbi:MAG TPA: hypothetical protein DEG92_00030 [Rikenellaceae bacterium]|nr:hypothetical protein [Rikenellaceae bacterium]
MARIFSQNAENKLLEAGRELLWKYGFRKVSVEDICKRAGVSKMTFYRYFENKSELTKRVLNNVVSEGTDNFRKILTDDTSVAVKMQRIIHLKMDGTKEISREFVEEIYNDPGSELQQFMIKLTTDTWIGILEEFKDAQARGVFRKDFKPEILLAMSRGFSELIADPKLNSLYSNTQEMIVEMTNLMTFGIAPRECEIKHVSNEK